jgi:NADH-ubiquinone oxidoreductase chain 3
MKTYTIFFYAVPVITLLLLVINFIFAKHVPYLEKDSPFECGYHSFSDQSRTQFSISFFSFGLFFLAFDIEIVLMFPLGVNLNNNEMVGMVVFLFFFIILTIGLVVEIGQGALSISSRQNIVRDTNNKKLINTISNYSKNNSFKSLNNISGVRKFSTTPLLRVIDSDQTDLQKSINVVDERFSMAKYELYKALNKYIQKEINNTDFTKHKDKWDAYNARQRCEFFIQEEAEKKSMLFNRYLAKKHELLGRNFPYEPPRISWYGPQNEAQRTWVSERISPLREVLELEKKRDLEEKMKKVEEKYTDAGFNIDDLSVKSLSTISEHTSDNESLHESDVEGCKNFDKDYDLGIRKNKSKEKPELIKAEGSIRKDKEKLDDETNTIRSESNTNKRKLEFESKTFIEDSQDETSKRKKLDSNKGKQVDNETNINPLKETSYTNSDDNRFIQVSPTNFNQSNVHSYDSYFLPKFPEATEIIESFIDFISYF